MPTDTWRVPMDVMSVLLSGGFIRLIDTGLLSSLNKAATSSFLTVARPGILFSFCFSEKKPTPDEFPRLSPHPYKDDAQDRRPRACRLSRCLRALCGAFASYHQVGACIVTDNIQALLLSLMPPRAGTGCLWGDMAREARGLEALACVTRPVANHTAILRIPVGSCGQIHDRTVLSRH